MKKPTENFLQDVVSEIQDRVGAIVFFIIVVTILSVLVIANYHLM